MYTNNEILVNIYHPVNKVTFLKVNPENPKAFVGVDEHGLYSENWELYKYVSLKTWNERVEDLV